MINYMVEIIYSEKISEVENMLKIENIQYEFTSRDGFIFFGFYEMTDAYLSLIHISEPTRRVRCV